MDGLGLLRLALAVVDLARDYLVDRSAPVRTAGVLEVHHYHHHVVSPELAATEPDGCPDDGWEPDPDEGELAARVLPDEALWDLLLGYGAAVRDGARIDDAARDVFLDLDMRHVESQVGADGAGGEP